VSVRWRFRTRFGDDVIVVRDWDARHEDAARRVPALFLRFELRNWLVGRDDGYRRQLLEMHQHDRGNLSHWGMTSPGYLVQRVLPELEEAFERGRFVAFKLPRPVLRSDLFPPEEAPAPPAAAPEQVEIVNPVMDGTMVALDLSEVELPVESDEGEAAEEPEDDGAAGDAETSEAV